ncbi:MAG: hypothetical protein QM768_21625 [Agriterribacter sp.]
MKLIDNVIYLEVPDAVKAGIEENTIWKANSRRSPSWGFIKDPEDKRKVLISYTKLNDRYKILIKNYFGDVKDYVLKEPLRKQVEIDFKAKDFYLTHRFDGNNSLSPKHVQKYTIAASWLNMLIAYGEDRKEVKRLFNLNPGDFWKQVCDIINSDKIDLPASYDGLKRKLNQYRKEGYPCLIHGQFGDAHAAKVVSEESQALLLTMCKHPNQYDDVWIAYSYNKWAKQNNHKTITAATVGNWRRKNYHLIVASREGNAALNENYLMEIPGLRPSTPLMLVESDDNNLDFLFADEKGYAFHKYVAIVVRDSFNNHVLGYSYGLGQSPSPEMVRNAYINAMYYIRSKTGKWYLPFEIKTDRWAKAQLYPFYESIAKYIKAKHGNSRRGYIEQSFGDPHWKRCQKIGVNNYSGNNITAPHRGVNQEALKLNAKNRPLIGPAAEMQIDKFFSMLRHIPDITRNNMDAPCKEAQWLEAFNRLADEDKREISDEMFLYLFGTRHEPAGKKITITNGGIEPQIDNKKYRYSLPDPVGMMKYTGAKVTVIYDRFDMSRVLITNDDDIRFVAYETTLQSRALGDATAGSRTELNKKLNTKKQQVAAIADASDRHQRILARKQINAEALLQGGVMIKELKNRAENDFEETLALPMKTTIDDEDNDPMTGW